ncbi:hypothetical protein LEP1GSC036_1233 [Leptospira weilii str. 2006001853]|uniref:Uncharacterized protein n=1 Tax=Leptospira weilii str. 2006001853 TaxID=1001589 RepID=A0A828Z142_9LEPT|nr:hypothetical protein LEP1GSC036_1233 [Leptospira weilii str. 2006001853]EMN43192.1 hypothetical protein LEP1GSC086_0321 [Leptospira weilii str. LNT 1234]QDK23571.1 hypothetical protein FHG67_13185 [Leptospira weilii]QDK26790.1 hypothetical protein FHG68_09065 [Leptospira weilii]
MLRKDKSEQFDSTQVLSDCIPIQKLVSSRLQNRFLCCAPKHGIFTFPEITWHSSDHFSFPLSFKKVTEKLAGEEESDIRIL